jgi:glycosyltransferase A (GT-A) superfamily protein (DUF2064 family)
VKLRIACLAAFAVAGCGGQPASPAPATQRTRDAIPELTTAQAAHRADRIALVVAGRSRVVAGVAGTPFTRTTFAVRRVLKGTLPHAFVLQVVGGRLGDRIVESPVQAFRPARRYVLFLGPDGPVGPTIFPQEIIEVHGSAAPTLASIRRDLR